MNFEGFRFYMVSTQYLRYLYQYDTEIVYSASFEQDGKNLTGILTTIHGFMYFIPLLSAKSKHKNWPDYSDKAFRVTEIVDARKCCEKTDFVSVPLNDNEVRQLWQKGIPDADSGYYVKRIYSVLCFGKMIPVNDSLITPVSFGTECSSKEMNRHLLEAEERQYCISNRVRIINAADDIYTRTQKADHPLTFRCNFTILEEKMIEFMNSTKI